MAASSNKSSNGVEDNLCPIFSSEFRSTSAQSDRKEFNEFNQHYNVEKSNIFTSNDVYSYTALSVALNFRSGDHITDDSKMLLMNK